MAHDLAGNRFMSRDVPAWHLLGTVFTEDITASQAVAYMNDQYGAIVIDKLPIIANVPEYGYTEFETDYVLVRRPMRDDPNPVIFGRVGPQYTVLQNEQIAQIVDILIEGTKGKWRLETTGILRKGETIFFALKGDSFTVAGDDMHMYFFLRDRRNGGSTIDMMATPIRVVCANTERIALANGNNRITLRHHADLFAEASWRASFIASAINQGNSMVSALQRLEKISIDENRMLTILEKLFPTPKAPRTLELKGSGNSNLINRAITAEYQYEYRKERAVKTRETVLENFRYLCDTRAASTGWEAFNSVTGWVDHQSGKQTDNGRRVMAERSLDTEMDDLRTNAYNYIVAGV